MRQVGRRRRRPNAWPELSCRRRAAHCGVPRRPAAIATKQRRSSSGGKRSATQTLLHAELSPHGRRGAGADRGAGRRPARLRVEHPRCVTAARTAGQAPAAGLMRLGQACCTNGAWLSIAAARRRAAAAQTVPADWQDGGRRLWCVARRAGTPQSWQFTPPVRSRAGTSCCSRHTPPRSPLLLLLHACRLQVAGGCRRAAAAAGARGGSSGAGAR